MFLVAGSDGLNRYIEVHIISNRNSNISTYCIFYTISYNEYFFIHLFNICDTYIIPYFNSNSI